MVNSRTIPTAPTVIPRLKPSNFLDGGGEGVEGESDELDGGRGGVGGDDGGIHGVIDDGAGGRRYRHMGNWAKEIKKLKLCVCMVSFS